MYEDFLNFKNEEQRNKVLNLFYLILSQNKTIDSISIDYIKNYLNDEDVAVFYELMTKYFSMKKPKVDKNKDGFKITYANYHKIKEIKIRKTPIQDVKLEWEEITPYIILGIEEKEYTKEELLDIIGKKINFIREHEMDKKKKNERIDKILDAYNDLTRESHKQK